MSVRMAETDSFAQQSRFERLRDDGRCLAARPTRSKLIAAGPTARANAVMGSLREPSLAASTHAVAHERASIEMQAYV